MASSMSNQNSIKVTINCLVIFWRIKRCACILMSGSFMFDTLVICEVVYAWAESANATWLYKVISKLNSLTYYKGQDYYLKTDSHHKSTRESRLDIGSLANHAQNPSV